MPSDPPRLHQLVDTWLSELRDRNMAPLTVVRYGEELRRLARFIGTECPAALDDPAAIDKALLVLFLRNGSVLPRPQAPTTWNVRLTGLRRFFAYLMREKIVPTDPSADLLFAHVPEKSPSFLARAEYDRLLRTVEREASDHYRLRDLAIFITLWNTGMRVGELASLNLDQIDFVAERFRGVRLKGRKVDDIHWNVEVAVVLRRWLVDRSAYRNAETETALFLSDRGSRISVRAIESLVGKYAKLADLGKRVTPHTMRHSAATELVRQGVPIQVVSEALRHRSLNVTRRYVHLVGAEVHAAVARLGNPLPSGKSATG